MSMWGTEIRGGAIYFLEIRTQSLKAKLEGIDMRWFISFIKREYNLLLPFILTVVIAQNVEFFVRSTYPNNSFIKSPFFLTLVISLDMLIATIYILLTLWSHTQENDQEYHCASESIIKYYKVCNGDLPNHDICGFAELLSIEGGVEKGEEIWIVTENIDDDINHPELSSVIEENLKRGVIYYYFLIRDSLHPDPTLIYNADFFKNKYKRYLGKTLHIIEIGERLIIPETYIIVYNALSSTKRTGFLAVEVGSDASKFSYQKLEDSNFHAIYNHLKNARALARPIKHSKAQRKTAKSSTFLVRRNKIVLFFNIVYSFFTVVLLEAIQMPGISSIESALQIIMPTIIITISSCFLIRVIDNVLEYKNNELLKCAKDNGIYSFLLLKSETVASDLESKCALQKEKTIDDMRLVTADHIPRPQKYNRAYILSSFSKEACFDHYRKLVEHLIRKNSSIEILFLLPDNLVTQGRSQHINDIRADYPKNITISRLNEGENIFLSHACDIICLIGEKTTDTVVYLLLGTNCNPIYKAIDISYVPEGYLAQILGRIGNIVDS